MKIRFKYAFAIMASLFLGAVAISFVGAQIEKKRMKEKDTNSLINETSPYLLQHAHNPVNWYPWGDEALAKAKAEDKLRLFSMSCLSRPDMSITQKGQLSKYFDILINLQI